MTYQLRVINQQRNKLTILGTTCYQKPTWQVLVSPVLVRVFESSRTVDFSGVGAHLMQDIELVLVTSTLVSGIYVVQFFHHHSEVSCGNLCVSTSQELKNSIVNENVLIL